MSNERVNSPEQIARGAARGALALLIRQGGIILLNGAGGIILARLLDPVDFGLYAVAVLFFGVMRSVGDAGIGASLIQQDATPHRADLTTAFTFQLLLAAVLGLAIASLAPFLTVPWNSNAASTDLVRLAALAYIIMALQLPATVQLERSLRFDRIGMAGLAETLAFNASATTLAAIGWGTSALGVALLVQAIAGTVCLYVFCPWCPTIGIELRRLKPMLRFGLAYQGAGLISLAKDSINPLFIGVLAGAAAVGYVGWANQFAVLAVIALGALQKLYLPVFARLMDDRDRLATAIERAVLATNALVAPVAITTLVLAGPIVHYLYGSKWIPGLHVFYWLWAANLIVPTVAPFLALFSAMGKPSITLMLAVLWMSCTWLFSAPLIATLGFVGFGIGNLLVQLTNVIVFMKARRVVQVSLLRSAFPPWMCGILQASVIVTFVWIDPPRTLMSLCAVGATGLTVYCAALLISHPNERRDFLRLMLHDGR